MSINRRTLSMSLHLKELDVVPKYTESISRRQGKKLFTQSENCATNKILNLFIKTFSQREWWMMGYYCGNDPSKSASHRLSAFEKHLEVLRTSVLDQALQTTLSHPQNLRVSPVGWLLSFLEWADYLFPYSFISFIYLFFPPALTRVRCHFQPLWKSLCVFGARHLLGLCTQPEPHVYTQLTLPLSEMTRNTSTDKYSSPACSFCSLARPGGLRAERQPLRHI